MGADARVAELKLVFPEPPKPMATYQPVVIVHDMAYVSGHGPVKADGSLITGRLGADLSEAEGVEAARVVGLAILANLQKHLGSLDRVTRLVKVLGMVNCTPDFTRQPAVINGFSDLMVEVFGESGRGARSAVGMMLPQNIAVEIEAIFQIRD